MTVKTEFHQEEFQQILANYNLGDFISSQPILEGTVQTNYKVFTTKGCFVFRYYENRTEQSVLFEVDLLCYLRKNYYPCPEPYCDKSGNIVDTYNFKPFVIFNYIEGYHIHEPNERQKKELIQKAAELHKITNQYSPIYKESRWNYNIEFCQNQFKQALQRLNTLNSQKKYEWAMNVLNKLDLPLSLSMGICHSDFHTSNLLYNNEKIVALLDFDDANYTYLLYDLVGLIETFAWTYHKYDVLDFTEAKKVVKEYLKHRALSETEKQHLFDVYKFSILIDCIWFFDRGNAEDFYEKRKIEFLEQLGREKFYTALFEVK